MKNKILITGGIFLFLALPVFAGLVPCGYGNLPQCTPCHIWVLASNIINFLLFRAAIPIVTLALLAGGIFMITAAGNPTQIAKGKSIIASSLIGIFIAFSAWLIVNTIINTISEGKLTAAWRQVDINQCDVPVIAPTTKVPTGGGITTMPTTGRRCTDCATLSVPAKIGACSSSAQGQTCQVNTVLNDRLVDLNKKIISDGKLSYWQVTEAWPPTVTHQAACHQLGTCVDANFIGNQNGAKTSDIKYFVEKANSSGLRAVYETKSQDRYNQLLSAGIPKDNLLRLDAITGEHFSVYRK